MSQNLEIFNPYLKEIVEHLNTACADLGIDFYLVGAVARDYHLSKISDYTPIRKTNDIDIAVMVSNENEFINLKKQLVKTGLFDEHKEPIKLIFKKSLELDLLPFGDIEEENITYLTIPKVFTLDMPGFTLLNHHTEDAEWNKKTKARICVIEGIVLLKLIANNDKPERTKDLLDIQQIIKLYFEVFSDNIFEDHFELMDIYDTKDGEYIQQVCAHVIGRKLKHILTKDQKLLERIIKILKQDKDLFWSNMLKGLTEG